MLENIDVKVDKMNNNYVGEKINAGSVLGSASPKKSGMLKRNSTIHSFKHYERNMHISKGGTYVESGSIKQGLDSRNLNMRSMDNRSHQEIIEKKGDQLKRDSMMITEQS